MGLGFDFMHYPGAGFLKVLSLSTLSIIYFMFAFAILNGVGLRELIKSDALKSLGGLKIGLSFGVGLVLSIASIGILFKLQFWPGANFNLLIGTGGLVISAGIAIIGIRKTTDGLYSRILSRAVLFGGLGMILLLLPRDTWLTWNYSDNPEYVKAVLNAEANPDDPALREKVDEEWEKMYNQDGE